MTAIYPAARFAGRDGQSAHEAAARIAVPWQAPHRIDWATIRTAERACCCSAQPRVVAVLPPASGREHRTEVLLCMHNFRTSRSSLAVAGAMTLDVDGGLIAPDSAAYLTA